MAEDDVKATLERVLEFLAIVRSDIAGLRAELKAEIAELRTELKAEIAELRTELKDEIAELRTEFRTDIRSVRDELRIVDKRLVAVEARLDEQRQTINALIPQRLAAVGR